MAAFQIGLTPYRVSSWGLFIVLLVMLAACGGGGSDPDPDDIALWNLASPPPPLPESSPERMTPSESGRFLVQATFGPSEEDIDAVAASGAGRWIEYQLHLPPTRYLPQLEAAAALGQEVPNSAPSDLFWEAGVLAPDQLRQRMVFALSQIVVVSSQNDQLGGKPLMMAQYVDTLSSHALGNYRDLLEAVTYTPAMAEYLTYLRNRKADMRNGNVPDENYAREIMQLFTIGLVELNPDGTPRAGAPETYDNEDVKGLAKVFTGLALRGDKFWEVVSEEYRYRPLQMYPDYHADDEKSFLGLTIPAGTDGATSIDMALDHLMAHPNVAPFVSRQLIQRFVTSHPSPAYVERVARVFEAGTYHMPSGRSVGDGRKGDLGATIAAILLDDEARAAPALNSANFGKLREPVLRLWHWARAFDVPVAKAEDSPWLRDASRADRLSQHPFRAPSVFNFFRPNYIAPSSETGAAGLTAPELQATSEVSHVGYVNMMSQYIREAAPISENGHPMTFRPQYAEEIALADQPDALLARLDKVLTYGLLDNETRQRIIAVLNEIPIDDRDPEQDRAARVHTAILMMMTAPEFLVQR